MNKLNANFCFCLGLLVLVTMSCRSTKEAQHIDKKDNIIIYQLLPRLFGNTNTTNKPFGTIAENGCGKFNDISEKALDGLKELNVDYVWYTGVIAHASLTDYSKFGIATGDADVVKGRAGSPYAIRDYYDVDPDLAVDVNKRMAEFEALIKRTHGKGLKVLIDFVPNHVARSYKSVAKPDGVEDFGDKDDKTVAYSATNDFYYLPGQDFMVPANSKSSGSLATLQDGKFAESPAKATGNNVFVAQPSVNDWYETVKLNYGVEFKDGKEIKHLEPMPPVWLKMRDILVYWTKKGVNGFRCDVAEMVPVEFWSWVIPEVKKVYPKLIFIGEAYNPKVYAQYLTEGKFDYLYDKVGLYDGLKRFVKDEANANIKDIQHVWQIESKGFDHQMLRFLENHDEERIAAKGFAGDAKLAFPAMVISATLGKGPLMLYFGQEVGEPGAGVEGFGGDDNRTSIFDYWGVPNHQRWVNGGKFDGAQLHVQERQIRDFYKKLTSVRANSDAVTNGAMTEIPLNGFPKAYAYVRHSGKQRILVVANFNRKENLQTSIEIPAQLLKSRKVSQAKDLLSAHQAVVKENVISVEVLPSSAQIIEF
ncbi:alpha-amylase family protein [Pedobacter sp. SL55]|uniref:alpha-amylase family protein n=1 Tax=Pedobacter sp. SL55 TaxID=2995161 RepID=UPI00226DD66C|nr:alpha-amylase family protein [Pedobacter sp. SL55]WAC42489.1 alpha-amylase family protein [Pedobacter sp. SL55]